MESIHKFGGFVIVGGWLLLFLWGCVLFVLRRDAGRPYWGLLTALQVLLGLQLVAGLALFAMGGRPAILHYFYGSVFPAIVLVVVHALSRGLEKPPYHVLFTIGAFFIFALAARALMTGLGIG